MSDYDVAAYGAFPFPPLLNRKEAAAWLGVSTRKLDALAASGELPRVRIGTAVRFEPQDLNAYAQSRKVG